MLVGKSERCKYISHSSHTHVKLHSCYVNALFTQSLVYIMYTWRSKSSIHQVVRQSQNINCRSDFQVKLRFSLKLSAASVTAVVIIHLKSSPYI